MSFSVLEHAKPHRVTMRSLFNPRAPVFSPARTIFSGQVSHEKKNILVCVLVSAHAKVVLFTLSVVSRRVEVSLVRGRGGVF